LSNPKNSGVDKTPSHQTRNEQDCLCEGQPYFKPRLNLKETVEKKFPLPDNVANDLDDIAKEFRDG